MYIIYAHAINIFDSIIRIGLVLKPHFISAKQRRLQSTTLKYQFSLNHWEGKQLIHSDFSTIYIFWEKCLLKKILKQKPMKNPQWIRSRCICPLILLFFHLLLVQNSELYWSVFFDCIHNVKFEFPKFSFSWDHRLPFFKIEKWNVLGQ